jgi:hypothetical protein
MVHTVLVFVLAVVFTSSTALAQTPSSDSAPKDPANHLACNLSALNPNERAIHERLTKRLISVRKAVVEYSKGYEFQFSPSDITVGELAAWVSNESKCCPFFDFHIDIEDRAHLLCLRLTGADGIKEFIRDEFNVPPPQK